MAGEIDFAKLEIPKHVKTYVCIELSMYKTYLTAVEEMAKDIADIKAQSRNSDYKIGGGGGGSIGNEVEDSAIRISVLQERIKAKQWRIRKIKSALMLFENNPDAMSIINDRWLSGASLDDNQAMKNLHVSNRNTYYMLKNQIFYKIAMVFGLVP